MEDTLLGTDYSQPSVTPTSSSSTEKSANTSSMPSADPLQLILAGLALWQWQVVTMETNNSSATSHEVIIAHSALVQEDMVTDKSSSLQLPFSTTGEEDHSLAAQDISDSRTVYKNHHSVSPASSEKCHQRCPYHTTWGDNFQHHETEVLKPYKD